MGQSTEVQNKYFLTALFDRSAWIIPSLKDPRWLLATFLFLYMLAGHFFMSFNRGPEQMIAAIVVCVSMDMLFTWILARKILFPLSSLISAFGLIILFSAPGSIWFILLVSWLTIVGKYLLTWRGHHFFNPTNFSLVFVALVAGDHTAISPSYQWGGTWWFPTVVFLFGMMLMWRVNKLWLVLTFWATFGIGAFIRADFSQMPLDLALYAQISGGAFMLFSFYMITDPKTSPASIKGMIIFGASIGMLDTVYQLMTTVYSSFYALFTVTLIRALFYIYKDMRDASRLQQAPA